MIVRDQIDWAKQQIAGAGGISSLLRVLDELQRLEPEQEEGEDLDDLRLDAFDALARLTQEAPGAAGPIILNHLLPLCLRARGEQRVSRVAFRYAEALSGWLDRYPAIHRFALRAVVLSALTDSLAGPSAERAAGLIAVLGYRDERAADRLLEQAQTGGDGVRDVALHVLAVLGGPPLWQAALVRLWLERASSATWNLELIGAARRLASVEILDPVFDRWLTAANLQYSDGAHHLLASLAIAVPADIARRYPNDTELQDRVWDRLRELEPANPDLFFQRVLGSTQLAHPCDSPGVVRYFLSRLSAGERTRDQAYFRLEECDRPRQLLGWEEDPGQEVVRAVLQDAEAANTMVGSFMTQDLRRKVHAWHTLLSLSRDEALTHVEDALAGEHNGHALGTILDFVACFRLDPVPRKVRELIAGEFGDMSPDYSERISSHVSAIAVAHASASSSAFEALMAFDLMRKGGVLISLLDALSDTAAALIREGDAGAAERLWQATAPGQPDHRRAAAAAALGRLLRRGLLHPLSADRLAALVEDETLDRYARSVLLESMGHLPCGEIPSEIERVLRRALGVANPPVGNGEARGGDFRAVALAALARLGLLSSDPDVLRQHLGLRLEGANWRYDRWPVHPGAAMVVGILYAREPGTFALATADLLREGDWTVVVQLADFLRSGPRPVQEPIIAAILQRVQRAGPEMGEPELIPLLADLAPGRISRESWSGMFGWPPQVRAALADALARPGLPEDLERSANLLPILMGDGQYGVRRAAFRAMARISQEKLHSVCTAWALLTEENVQPLERPYMIDMRRRAAEAAAWLEPIPAGGPVANLAFDPEPDVRETFARCQRERHERDWAAEYLGNVLAVCNGASLLKAWKYGRVLERVGDDESLERLEQQRRRDCPPAIRHWLGRLIKKLRARWDEVTRSWPEPWFARRGRLERVDALVGDDEPNAKRVSCWLWQVPATDLVQFSVWGGWCLGESLSIATQTLRVVDRRPATIHVTSTVVGSHGTGPTYFTGTGPYPELVP